MKKGSKMTLESRAKISKSLIGNNRHLGKKVSEKTKERIKNKLIGNIPWNKGKTGCQNGGTFKHGEEHPYWQGGKSKYSKEFNEGLRRIIRIRDKYTCYICKKEPATDVHHIDYDKFNCNPTNLITLCHSCHSKTNYNRKKWIEFFNKLFN